MDSNGIEKKEIIQEKIIKVNGDTAYRFYEKGKHLGKGGYAQVFEFLSLDTGHRSAVKLIKKTSLSKPHARAKLTNEMKIHRQLQHKNIVKFENSFEDGDYIYMFLELCKKQTLSDMIKSRGKLTEAETKCLLFQILEAVKYLHSKQIIHRDLKLGNIFFSEDMELKVGDFGLASKIEFEGDRKRSICGTPNYIAPEILDYHKGHSFAADVWSIGVLAYIFLTGRAPFNDASQEVIYEKICGLNYQFPSKTPISDHFKTFIRDIFVLDDSSRPSVDELLMHPIFCDSFPVLLPEVSLESTPSSKLINKTPQIKKTSKINTVSKKRILRKKTLDKMRSPLRTRDSFSSRKAVIVSVYCQTEKEKPIVCVKKWVDYSQKYGLGYTMSNGRVGVYFNDSTKMICLGNEFHYFHKAKTHKIEKENVYSFENYPEKLKKKATLLEQFVKTLGKGIFNNSNEMVYIKKWITSKHANIFRLNNKTVQVYFNDNTELIMGARKGVVVFIDKNRESLCLPINKISEEQNPKVFKRIQYTKETLTGVIVNSPKGNFLGSSYIENS